MKTNQGKSKQQYKDSVTFAFIGYFGIVLVVLLTFLGVESCTPENKEVRDEWDQGECGDETLLDVDSGGSDEYKIWIGENGDTIWE